MKFKFLILFIAIFIPNIYTANVRNTQQYKAKSELISRKQDEINKIKEKVNELLAKVPKVSEAEQQKIFTDSLALSKQVNKISDEIYALRVDLMKLESGQATSEASESPEQALFSAIQNHDVQKVKALVNGKKVNINARDSVRKTPLIVAAELGHDDIVGILMGAGANIDAVDQQGQTALSRAIAANQFSTFKKLLSANADQTQASQDAIEAKDDATQAKILAIMKESIKEDINSDVARKMKQAQKAIEAHLKARGRLAQEGDVAVKLGKKISAYLPSVE